MSANEAPERWVRVAGYRYYEVSSHARARSVDHLDAYGVWRPGVILKPWMDENGYLHLTLYQDGRSKKPYLHSVVARAFLGPRPPGQEVCHGPNGQLDNRPSNLSYGTRFKNCSLDKIRDGTILRGEDHQNSKLTMAIVAECRRRAAAGASQQSLADEFGVCQETIWAAVTGKTWRECDVPPVLGRRRGERHPDAKLTEAIIRECYARNKAGETLQVLARQFGVTRPALYAAVIGKTWKHLRLDRG